mmetsp:Transcript_15818/g.34237  ORF Transcript_15818/g.34237 Transcript_15818/m.34237 type:complete len:301 (+) Transcript_15818:261-1163(+)|eukprot:CAMPEP_0172327942 /NCGR_PEP_ID=MMETSP1058-20130122/60093_1 /TAXON_ID=83371 /ORGANISM="Detonula confervacea, Strain CCMP 353" /LENGTH=300 /DNA_ID=CAMNT_0013045033 /DNA_START=169 /DNA_END=1071 /DNA_ORIENTATION=+
MSEEAWVDFVSGWISGGVSVLACQPIDTVLTRMQANAGIQAATGVGEKVTSRPGAAAANIFRGMISNFGFASLWRGSSAMIGAVPVQNALLMTGYGAGKRWSESNDSSSSNNVLMGVFVGGCAGGVLQSFVMSPVELVKVTQQVVGESVTSATSTVCRGIFSSTGAWKGLGATLLRDGVPHGVWFASYEYAKTELTNYRKRTNNGNDISEDNFATPMLAGAFAATTAWAVGYPADLIKTRIQAGSGEGIFATAKDIVNESGGRGVLGLYNGFSLKLLRAVPASAIGFLIYETAAKYLTSK